MFWQPLIRRRHHEFGRCLGQARREPMNERHLTITIAGCGALGSLLAARLLAAGHRVQAFQRQGPQLQELVRNGITLDKDRDGSSNRYRLHGAADDPAQLTPSRLVIVLVKAYHTAELKPLAELLTADGMVLTLQNGLGNAEVLEDLFGSERVAAGVATYGAHRLAPGVIAWGGDGQITFGPWRQGTDVDWIKNLLRQAGLRVNVVNDPRPAIWTKLAINAMVNTVTALTGMRNGEVAGNSPALELMQQLGRETVAAAARAGVLLDNQTIWEMMRDNLARTAVNRTSMLQDVAASRRTEIDYIAGGVLRYAASDLEFPYTRAVYNLIRAIDLQAQATASTHREGRSLQA
jgi:2-dehydropantoate 2-reductase